MSRATRRARSAGPLSSRTGPDRLPYTQATASAAERRNVVPPAASTAATIRSCSSARLSAGRPLIAAPAPWLLVKRQ